MVRVVALMIVLGWSGWCLAAAGHAPAPGSASQAAETYPAVPPRPVWAGTMVAVIGVMFAAALVAGLLSPEDEMPVTHSHDEPPGSIHGHGHH